MDSGTRELSILVVFSLNDGQLGTVLFGPDPDVIKFEYIYKNFSYLIDIMFLNGPEQSLRYCITSTFTLYRINT